MTSDTSTRLGNQERWEAFIAELRGYIEEHQVGPSKHTALYNQCKYFRKRSKEGKLDSSKARDLEEVLSMRDLSIHTGGRKKRETEEQTCIKL